MVFYSFFSDAIDKALRTEDIFAAIINIMNEYAERKKNLIEMLRSTNFTPVERHKIINYISLENYFNEIIKNLIREDTAGPTEFAWIKYPFVKIEGNDCKVLFFQNEIIYGKEYVGLYNNFTTTPQSERFFLSLATCIINQRSSVIYGLNESNKKESFKIFSKMIGHYPFFIKCNNLMDTRSFINIKSAIQRRGNWLAVCDFEKLTIEQLSIISEEINSIYRYFHDADSGSVDVERKMSFFDAERKIMPHINTQIFCLYNIDQKFNPHPNIKNMFRLVGVTSPDLGLFVQLSLRNLRIDNYKSLHKRIVYVLEYLNSKIESIQYRSKRLCMIYFKQFMKFLNVEVVKTSKRVIEDYELIRTCLENVFQTKFFDNDFVEVKKFIRSVFIMESEIALKKLKSKPIDSEKEKSEVDIISLAVEEISRINSFNTNEPFKTKIQNVTI